MEAMEAYEIVCFFSWLLAALLILSCMLPINELAEIKEEKGAIFTNRRKQKHKEKVYNRNANGDIIV